MSGAITQLTIYNGALRLLKSRKLATLADNVEPRRVLDDVWADDFVDECLSEGQWIFATRSTLMDFDPSIEPTFGYKYAFDKPEDWLRTLGVWQDQEGNTPLTRYADEIGFWMCDWQTIYVSYVSNDASYGGDMSRWPPLFVRWMECRLAKYACPRITDSDTIAADVEKKDKKWLVDAKSKNAMAKPTQFLPRGNWSVARMGGWWKTPGAGGSGC